MEGDPPLEYRQRDACRQPLFLAKSEFLVRRRRRCAVARAETSADVTSQLSLRHIFITDNDMGRFIAPRQNKEAVNKRREAIPRTEEAMCGRMRRQ